MAELQERRRSLQSLLSTRLAELRRVCLQEAVSGAVALPALAAVTSGPSVFFPPQELTGVLPGDFPLEAGEKAPCVRRRGGACRRGNRKYPEVPHPNPPPACAAKALI